MPLDHASAAPQRAQTSATRSFNKPLNDAQLRLIKAIQASPHKISDDGAYRAFAAARTRLEFEGHNVRHFWSAFEERVLRRETEDLHLQLCNEAVAALFASGHGPKIPAPPRGYLHIVGIADAVRAMGPDGQLGPARSPAEVAAIEEYEMEARLHARVMSMHRKLIAAWVREGMLAEMERHPTKDAERAAENAVLRAAVGEVQGLPEGGDRGGDLLDGDTPEIDWLVDGLLPSSGLMLIAGRPKGGKSTLLYQLLYCVTTGMPFLDAKVKAPALAALISADDPNRARVRRRFQTVRMLMPGAGEPEVQDAFKANMVEAFYEWPGGERFLPAVEKLLSEHADLRLIVIDAYASIQKSRKPNADLFQADYDEFKAIAKVAHERGVLMLLAIHTRKAQSFAGDPIDEVQKTSGLTAAIDDFWGIRFDPKIGRTMLTTKGRSLDQNELSLSFIGAPKASGGGGYFKQEGAPLPKLSDFDSRALDAVTRASVPQTVRQVAQALGVSDVAALRALRRLQERERVEALPKARGAGQLYRATESGDEPEGEEEAPPLSHGKL